MTTSRNDELMCRLHRQGTRTQGSQRLAMVIHILPRVLDGAPSQHRTVFMFFLLFVSHKPKTVTVESCGVQGDTQVGRHPTSSRPYWARWIGGVRAAVDEYRWPRTLEVKVGKCLTRLDAVYHPRRPTANNKNKREFSKQVAGGLG